MYADPDTMIEEGNSPYTKKLLWSTKKWQLWDQSQNIGLDLVT